MIEDDYFTCNYDTKRGCFVIIDDTGNGYALKDADCVVKLVNLLNTYDKKLRYAEHLIARGVVKAFELDPEVFTNEVFTGVDNGD